MMSIIQRLLSWPLGLLAGAVLLLGLGSGVSIASVETGQGEADESFCAPRLLRDYERPLRHLPRLHSVPKGKLPFGPRGLELSTVPGRSTKDFPNRHVIAEGNRYALPEGGDYGYHIHLSPSAQRPPRWRAAMQLFRLNGRGMPVEEIESRHVRLSSKEEPSTTLVIDAPAETGIYRLDIQFRSHRQRLLGSYADYVRVMKPRLAARLGINGSVFHPGEMLAATLENFGTAILRFDNEFAIEKLEDGAWVPVALTGIGWNPFVGGALAGWSSSCVVDYTLPTSFSPGHYRLVKPFMLKSDAHRRTAEFDVVG